MKDGTVVAKYIVSKDKKASEYDESRRNHPFNLFILHYHLFLKLTIRDLFIYVRERQ